MDLWSIGPPSPVDRVPRKPGAPGVSLTISKHCQTGLVPGDALGLASRGIAEAEFRDGG